MAELSPFVNISNITDSLDSYSQLTSSCIFFTNNLSSGFPSQYGVGINLVQRHDRKTTFFASTGYTKGVWARVMFGNDDTGWIQLG